MIICGGASCIKLNLSFKLCKWVIYHCFAMFDDWVNMANFNQNNINFRRKLKLQSDLFTVIPSVQIFGHKTIYLKHGADNIRLMY